MGKLKDLTGQRFGRLVVKSFAGYKKQIMEEIRQFGLVIVIVEIRKI